MEAMGWVLSDLGQVAEPEGWAFVRSRDPGSVLTGLISTSGDAG